MRRIVIVLSVVVFLAVVLVSCGSTKTCPAYSSAEVEQTTEVSC